MKASQTRSCNAVHATLENAVTRTGRISLCEVCFRLLPGAQTLSEVATRTSRRRCTGHRAGQGVRQGYAGCERSAECAPASL